MQLDGRRQSTNVDDRRGMSTGKVAGGVGLGGLIIIGLITLLMGGDPTEVLQQVNQMGGTEIVTGSSGREATAEEEELAVFAKQILAGTEDVWTAIFKQYGRTYEPPRLVLYTDYVQTAVPLQRGSEQPDQRSPGAAGRLLCRCLGLSRQPHVRLT